MVRPDLSVPRPSLEMSIPSIVILPAAGSVILKYDDSGEGPSSTLLEYQPEYGECQTGLAGSLTSEYDQFPSEDTHQLLLTEAVILVVTRPGLVNRVLTDGPQARDRG